MNGLAKRCEGIDQSVLNTFPLQIPQFQPPEIVPSTLLADDRSHTNVVQPMSALMVVPVDGKQIQLVLITSQFLQVRKEVDTCRPIGPHNSPKVFFGIRMDR